MVTINVISNKRGRIKKLFEDHYPSETDIDNDVMEWLYIYRDAKQAEAVVSKLIMHAESYGVTLWIKMDDGDLTQIA